MAEFAYKVIDGGGAPLSGRIEAASVAEAQTRLKLMHPYVVSIKEKSSRGLFGARKLSIRELTIFTRQLALMIGAGMSLRPALEAIMKQPISDPLKNEIDGIVGDLESGSSFSETLSRRPRTFFPFYISMVKTGETAGILHQTLDRLANHMDAENGMRQKIQSAFIYPLIMLLVAVGVLAIMTVFVLPRFETIFQELNVPLPAITEIILGISGAVRNYWWMLAVLGVAGFFAVKHFWAELDLQEKARKVIWRVPLTTNTMLPVEMARLCRSVSLLDQGGVPILQSLKVIAGSLHAPSLRTGVDAAIIGLEEGQPLSNAFQKAKVFPDFLIQMLGVAEKTGQLASVMERLAEYYDQQVEILLERIAALIEPMMILILSVMVGIIVLSMLLPIFGLSEAFSQ